VVGDGEIVRSATRVAVPAGGAARPAARPSPGGRIAPSKPAVKPADGPEEISIDEPMDLEELAELARRIERRTP
jgi:hypothetical protein